MKKRTLKNNEDRKNSIAREKEKGRIRMRGEGRLLEDELKKIKKSEGNCRMTRLCVRCLARAAVYIQAGCMYRIPELCCPVANK